MLNGIKSFLEYVDQNWTSIVVIVGLALAIYKKAKVFFEKSTDEKIAIAKEQMREVILKFITDAEVNYADWQQAGPIKRSEVIQRIFEEFPILSKATDQASLVEWIDNMIDESLVTLREIMKSNTQAEDQQN